MVLQSREIRCSPRPLTFGFSRRIELHSYGHAWPTQIPPDPPRPRVCSLVRHGARAWRILLGVLLVARRREVVSGALGRAFKPWVASDPFSYEHDLADRRCRASGRMNARTAATGFFDAIGSCSPRARWRRRLVSAAVQVEAVEFSSAGGMCRGVLYQAGGSKVGRPGVVILAHGLSGTRLTQYDRRARRLVQDGVAVLDFDPRFVGTSPGNPRQQIDAFAWLADLRAAVGYVRSRDDVDPERVGLYGSSLGGGLSLAVAAEDQDIRALALDVPAIDGLRATPSPARSRPALLAAVVRDMVGRRRGRPPLVLPVFGEVGSAAVVQNDVNGFWRAMDEIEGLQWLEPRRVARHAELGEWRNEATAFELMSSVRLRPARRVAAVRCPVLAHISEDDRVVPFGPTRKALGRIAAADIRTLRGGHFAPFYGEGFETTTAAQATFFARTLMAA